MGLGLVRPGSVAERAISATLSDEATQFLTLEAAASPAAAPPLPPRSGAEDRDVGHTMFGRLPSAAEASQRRPPASADAQSDIGPVATTHGGGGATLKSGSPSPSRSSPYS